MPNSQFLITVDFPEILPKAVKSTKSTPCSWSEIMRADIREKDTSSLAFHRHDLWLVAFASYF